MFTSAVSKRILRRTDGLHHTKYEAVIFPLISSFSAGFIKVKRQRAAESEVNCPSDNAIPCTGLFHSMWNVEPKRERVRRRAGFETEVWETEETYLKHSIELTLYRCWSDCTKRCEWRLTLKQVFLWRATEWDIKQNHTCKSQTVRDLCLERGRGMCVLIAVPRMLPSYIRDILFICVCSTFNYTMYLWNLFFLPRRSTYTS